MLLALGEVGGAAPYLLQADFISRHLLRVTYYFSTLLFPTPSLWGEQGWKSGRINHSKQMRGDLGRRGFTEGGSAADGGGGKFNDGALPKSGKPKQTPSPPMFQPVRCTHRLKISP